jgi:cAMP and cAMP-inhibited cGMP 3',5'-cyclic phosphodiesterase 10
MRFILTVRKNYRNVPYHNWSHAFSVAHAIYTVIKQTKHQFTPNDVGSIELKNTEQIIRFYV